LETKILLCGPTLIDDEILQALLKTRFNLFLVPTCHDLQQAIHNEEITLNEKTRLLVLEFSMNWPAEVEVLRKLLVENNSLGAIVINGNRSDEAVVKAFHHGAMDFFAKPYSKELLAERIEALVQHGVTSVGGSR
jgi:FixJ family two-component response regulator